MGHGNKDVEREGVTAGMRHYSPFSFGTTYSAMDGFALNKHWGKKRKLGIRVHRGLSINFKGEEGDREEVPVANGSRQPF